jgi:hypothetical protein
MLLEMMVPIESIRMAKNQPYALRVATDFEEPANALNCLYLDCDARGLDPFVVLNNILIECRKIIN